ncbi:MAG: MFS transporter [Rhodospirillales bacterium]|nr:MFS transporter [Rhodospirillales bacterium]
MIAAIVSVWALLVGIGLLMVGSGLQGSLLGIRASAEGFSVLVTGLVMSSYFAGFVLGSLATPRLIRRVGHIRVFGALTSLASITALLHATFVDPIVWGFLRVMTGFCYIGLFIVAESWLNDRSTNETRGRLLSLYMIVMTGSMATGPLLLNIGRTTGFELFVAASVLVSIAFIPLSLTAYAAPRFEEQDRFSIRQLMEVSPLGVAGCLVNGATAGALVSLVAVYGKAIGLSIDNIALLASASILGGTILVWPLGRLSDRFDRRLVLTGTALAGGTLALGIVLLGVPSPTLQILAVAVVGGFIMPLYSLSVAHTNDHLHPNQMVAASSGLLLANGIGGMAGPTMAGAAMELLGPPGFLWFPAGAMLALAGFAIFRMTRRSAVPAEEQRDFVRMPRTSGIMADAALRNQRNRMDSDPANTFRHL